MTLRFSAFDNATTPQVEGVVRRVSPDVTHNAQSGQPSYVVRIA